MRPRRAAAGLLIGAAGMVASRLSGRRGAEAQPARVEPEPREPAPSGEQIERARAELAEALAHRSAQPDNAPR
jgi:hypothetical protein